MWIDTHCHLDAAEFDADRDAVVARARAAGVLQIVIPAVNVHNLERVRELAHARGLSYALGIHPLCVMGAAPGDLNRVAEVLERHADDQRLVAVGEIGLDYFVEGIDPDTQQHFYVEQLKIAKRAGLPVLLHVRRSADKLLAGLRRVGFPHGGIAHAFNGSEQQAQAFIDLGFKLGFGGTLTFERSLQIRRIAAQVPETALVMETDAPDIPPHWLYKTAEEREAHPGQARNESAELPRIAESLAELRGWTVEHTATITSANARAALPRLT
ncbi:MULTISPECIES: TatD family hydrolase [unclassified Roseateles]|uniref:TatD family hydrolase n=1 Tax=unclassified Roseateles TaxID=2626991 RepID=UPI0006F66E46|nr:MULTISPECIES: TatD family hydrolase [unclassified Roseateles]KQW42738.1 DNAase [Pelomonas sp. Root405]KRA69415.1 DNAase [Pelomonas sp. Root662]